MNEIVRAGRREQAIRCGAALGILAGLSLAGWAPAQECEVPLFIRQGSVDANVMVLFDNSGSMNEAMFHPDYDPNTVYPVPGGQTGFTAATVYYIPTDLTRTPRQVPPTNNARPASPSILLVNSDGGESGRYYGNYLNWMYFHATAAQRAAIPAITRVQVAKAVVNDIINRSEHVRFGLTRFNTSDGGQVIANCGTPKSTVMSTVSGIRADTWTPLAETMEDILTYFKGTGAGAPIQQHCQYNFLIVMTDGFPTMDLAVSEYLRDADGDGQDPCNCACMGAPYPETNDCSGYMDDVAYYMRHNDLRGDLEGTQSVITYAVGFGIDAGILQDTADNGDGFYMNANNAAELWVSLARIMQDIITRISSGAAVAVVSTERGDEDRLFRGKFMPGLWRGYLEAFELPYEEGESGVWEAGYLMSERDPATREIFTGLGNYVYAWNTDHADDLMSALNVSTEDSASALIQWARGVDVAGYRDRNGWALGDIVHSTPVVVGAPSSFTLDESYQTFVHDNRERTKIVYVGGNDGMLHAFRAEDGHEVWAFVPEFALPKLKTIADSTYCHTYTCDLTPSIRDVKLGGQWKTLLVGGGREGGTSYFALDITSPTSPALLWQTDLPGIQDTRSEAEYAIVDDTPLVLVGSGLDETTGEANLHVLDLETGTVLGTRHLSTVSGGRNKATTPKAVDTDLDGDVDVVYVGDMQGNLWRFGIEDDSDPSTWQLTRMLSCGQPITAQPTVAYGAQDLFLVYFGTGAYLTDSDITSTSSNSFYCVLDRADGAELTPADLVDQTDDPADIGDADGWFVDLWHQSAGERVTERAVVVANTVYFTSFAPSAVPCEAGGVSWLYHLNYLDGGEPEVDEEHEDEPEAERSEELGEGVASRPVVDIVNENIIVQSSDATINVQDIGQAIFHLTVRSWQENFDFVPESGGQQVDP